MKLIVKREKLKTIQGTTKNNIRTTNFRVVEEEVYEAKTIKIKEGNTLVAIKLYDVIGAVSEAFLEETKYIPSAKIEDMRLIESEGE